LIWEIDLPAGKYDISLYFAEIFNNAITEEVGFRVIDVYINNVLVADNLDITEEVGGYAAYFLKNKNIDVRDGLSTIELVGVKENVKISALAILPASSSETDPPQETFSTADSETAVTTEQDTVIPTPEEPPIIPNQPAGTRINAGVSNYTDLEGTTWASER
jgi:ABC-type uncharacterized transport system permease subunit